VSALFYRGGETRGPWPSKVRTRAPRKCSFGRERGGLAFLTFNFWFLFTSQMQREGVLHHDKGQSPKDREGRPRSKRSRLDRNYRLGNDLSEQH
jgi:hypothetical protein